MQTGAYGREVLAKKGSIVTAAKVPYGAIPDFFSCLFVDLEIALFGGILFS